MRNAGQPNCSGTLFMVFWLKIQDSAYPQVQTVVLDEEGYSNAIPPRQDSPK